MRYLIMVLLALSSTLTAAPKLIIGIAGGTGSGKSTIAKELLHNFEGQAVLINQDNYYKDLRHMTDEERENHNFDHPDAIDFSLLRDHLLALKNNESIEEPIYNFTHFIREDKTITLWPANVIIVEGILLFAQEEVRALFDLKIYIDADDDIRLLRRIERDILERNRHFESIRTQYLTTVKPMHNAFVEPSKRYADIIIPTLHCNKNSVSLIVSAIKTNEHSNDAKDFPR